MATKVSSFRANYGREGGNIRRKGKVEKAMCYDSKLKGLSNELTLVLSDTRELDGVLSTK